MSDYGDYRQTLTKLIALVMPEGFELPPHKTNPHFVSDLGMDSLALVSLIVLCEQEFSLNLSDDPNLLNRVSTVDDAVQYLVNKRGGISAAGPSVS